MPEFNEGLARTRSLFHDAGLRLLPGHGVSLSGGIVTRAVRRWITRAAR